MIRRTKIIATLGPATDSPEMIGRLLDAGMNIARLNMSHSAHDWVRKTVKYLREAAAARNIPVGILMDTQGPSIRTGNLPVPLDLQPGQAFTFTVRGEKSEELYSVDVNYDNFINDIHVGDTVLLDNGDIRMKVISKEGNHIRCEVLTPGKLGSRRHINLPGVKVSLPPLTAKDLQDIALGVEMGVDYIALSFVREASDLRELRAQLSEAKRPPLVIAKIEDQQAVKNISSIIAEADAVMVARGDLGIECPYEELPIIQRKVVKACLRLGKPVIVATHMLESMIHSPMPTRAEITDVANAVYEQSDAIMLSGETTVGKYPIQCVEVFDRIARRIERSGGANYHQKAELVTARQKLIKSAVVMGDQLLAEAIIVFTRRGTMARYASWLRPQHSCVLAICEDSGVAEQLTLNWGVRAMVYSFDYERSEITVERTLASLLEKGILHKGNTVVIVSPITSGEQMFDAVQMRVL
ncbi:MAG: pyruvate kinase [Verrucomicrobiales bacterium]|nr:pyruvate kinase [Verrucomicrobiales bacterium]